MCHLYPFLDQVALLIVTHALLPFVRITATCSTCGLPLKNIQKDQLVQKTAAWVVYDASYVAHVTSLLWELH